MAMTTLSFTVTLPAAEKPSRWGFPGVASALPELRAFGVTICPVTGAITRLSRGLFIALNREEAGTIELGDRIIEVEGKTGPVQELLDAWLVDGELPSKQSLRVKLLRPLLIQPVQIPMTPGERLGLDLSLEGSNIVLGIAAGPVADLNKAFPDSVGVGDRIVEVDGKTGHAVDLLRAWVMANKEAPAHLELKVARRALTFKQMLVRGSFKGMSEPNSASSKPKSAWQFSVPVRVLPGETLGMSIQIDSNSISNIEAPGAITRLNGAYPGSVRVGDRIVAVDGIPCPYVDATEKLESWFQGKFMSKGTPQDLRLTVLRPVERGAAGSMLPPCTFSPGVDVEDDDCMSADAEAEADSAGTSSTAVSRDLSVTWDLENLGLIPDVFDQTVPSVEEKLEKKPRKSMVYEGFVDLRKRGRSWVASYVIH